MSAFAPFPKRVKRKCSHSTTVTTGSHELCCNSAGYVHYESGVKKSRRPSVKPDPTSVRWPDDIKERMEKIVAATGASYSYLAIECVKLSLDRVAIRIAEKRKSELDEFTGQHPGPNGH